MKKIKKKKINKVLAKARAAAQWLWACWEASLNAAHRNRLWLIHTLLLGWLIFRTEQIHALLTNLFGFFFVVGMEIAIRVRDAQEQFGAAIQSILNLFGGDSGA
jgi:hypothetical protein